MSTGTYKELQQIKGVTSQPDPATKGFKLQQTMLRIKDPEKSLDFYTRVMGMTLLTKLEFPQYEFDLYFLGYYDAADVPQDPKERTKWTFQHANTLELTHNYGTESKDDFSYHSGNSDPRGFGHIGFDTPDVQAACKRFTELGVEFQKRLEDGSMNNIAFIKDPDGYWIELFSADQMNF